MIHGKAAESCYHFWLDDSDLLREICAICFYFSFGGCVIFRRNSFNYSREIRISTGESDFAKHFVDYLSILSDEKFFLLVFHKARSFADEHNLRVYISFAENKICRFKGKRAVVHHLFA